MIVVDSSCRHDVHELCHLVSCECTCHGENG